MADSFASLELPPLPMNAFMRSIPSAVRSACATIGIALPAAIHVTLNDETRDEFSANETVVEAVHPCGPEALESVRGLSGHHHVEDAPQSTRVAVVATLRREMHRREAEGIRVFWHIRAVRLPAPDAAGQMSLFG